MTSVQILQHNDANTSHLFLVRQVLLVNTSRDRGCSVVVKIKVKLAITCTKLQLLQEERVVLQGKGVEHIEVGLENIVSYKEHTTPNQELDLYLLGLDQGIVHQE